MNETEQKILDSGKGLAGRNLLLLIKTSQLETELELYKKSGERFWMPLTLFGVLCAVTGYAVSAFHGAGIFGHLAGIFVIYISCNAASSTKDSVEDCKVNLEDTKNRRDRIISELLKDLEAR